MRAQLSPLKEWITRTGALFGDAARAVDRAIRRIEDRHRGPLPYMRRPAPERPETSFAVTLQTLADEAWNAERAALETLESTGTLPPGTMTARRLRALADELAALTMDFCSIDDGQEPREGRAEPVWAAGLSRRFTRFVGVAEQWATPPPDSDAPGTIPAATVTPSRPRRSRPLRPDRP